MPRTSSHYCFPSHVHGFSCCHRGDAFSLVDTRLGFCHRKRSLIEYAWLRCGNTCCSSICGPRMPWCVCENRVTYTLLFTFAAGAYGTVTPQPVDLVVTAFPPLCNTTTPGCTVDLAQNQDTILYQLPPWSALANAWTGMHEFKRDIVPPLIENPSLLLVMTGVLAVVSVLHATAFHSDWPWTQPKPLQEAAWVVILCRLLLASVPCLLAVLGMVFWSSIYYPVCLMHIFAMATVAITGAASITLSVPSSFSDNVVAVVGHFVGNQHVPRYSRVSTV